MNHATLYKQSRWFSFNVEKGHFLASFWSLFENCNFGQRLLSKVQIWTTFWHAFYSFLYIYSVPLQWRRFAQLLKCYKSYFQRHKKSKKDIIRAIQHAHWLCGTKMRVLLALKSGPANTILSTLLNFSFLTQ